MRKNTFYSMLFLATLTGCYFVEKANPTYEIAKAESESVTYVYEAGKTDAEIYDSIFAENPEMTDAEIEQQMFGNWIEDEPDYNVYLIGDSIKITDSETGEQLFAEHYTSESQLAKLILKDNE